MVAGLAHASVLVDVAIFAVAVGVKVSRSFHFHLSCAMYIHTHTIGRCNCQHTGGEDGTVPFEWRQRHAAFFFARKRPAQA